LIESYIYFFNKSFLQLLFFHLDIYLGLLVFVYIIFVFLKKRFLDLAILLGILLASIILYFYQQKGWHYHLLPFFIFTIFALVYTTIIYTDKKRWIFIFVFIPMIVMILMHNLYKPTYPQLQTILHNLKPKSKIIIFSTDMAMGEPLLVHQQIWSSRFNALWMLPTIFQTKNKFLTKYMNTSIEKDFIRYVPDFIIFPSFKNGFDYYTYLSNEDKNIKKYLDNNYIYTKKGNYIIFYSSVIAQNLLDVDELSYLTKSQ